MTIESLAPNIHKEVIAILMAAVGPEVEPDRREVNRTENVTSQACIAQLYQQGPAKLCLNEATRARNIGGVSSMIVHTSAPLPGCYSMVPF